MRAKAERLSPRRVLALFGQGLIRCWPIMLAVGLVASGINVGAIYLQRPFGGPDLAFGVYALKTVGQIALLSLVSTVLVAWMIHRLEPEAMDAERPQSRIAWGWGGAFLSGLIFQAPTMASTAILSLTQNIALTGPVFLVQGVIGLILSVVFGYAQGEALTRRIGPLRALAASWRVTRGNRLALLVYRILVGGFSQGAFWSLSFLSRNLPDGWSGSTRAVAQGLLGALLTILGTAVYLDLRRAHRASQPEGISETFD